MRKSFALLLVSLFILGGCSTPWFELTFKGEDVTEEDLIEKTQEDAEQEENEEADEETEIEEEDEEEKKELSLERTLEEFLPEVDVIDEKSVSNLAFVSPREEKYDVFDGPTSKLIGIVKDGEYKGYTLNNMFYPGLGSMLKSTLYLENPETKAKTFIDGYLDSEGGTDIEDIIASNGVTYDFKIKELQAPERIYLEEFNVNIEGGELYYDEFKSSQIKELQTIDSPYGSLYQSGSRFYLPLVDDFFTMYVFDAGEFWTGPNKMKGFSGKDTSIAHDYSSYTGGCGWFGEGYHTIEADLLDLGNLKSLGSWNDLKYYEPIGVNEEYGKDEAYERNLVAEVWATYKFSNSDSKLTFEEFMEAKPVLFWKDPFGNFASLVRSDMKPASECGKPVIYLYPEKPMNVDVAVEIEEFTLTIPEHGKNGWSVLAYPDGEIYNYADKERYDYLFWEGYSEEAVSTNDGFAVEKKELDLFFDEKLNELGLNKQEISDFKEYWVPVMENDMNDWFFVTFVGTEEFNKVAPLQITPKPDTLARVFMYYEGRPGKFDVLPQKLESFDRNGFTVVEWGGTTNKPWK